MIWRKESILLLCLSLLFSFFLLQFYSQHNKTYIKIFQFNLTPHSLVSCHFSKFDNLEKGEHSFFFLSITSLFFFLFLVAQLHACVVCIALPASLAMVPTQGFYFAFAAFLLFLENKYALARRG